MKLLIRNLFFISTKSLFCVFIEHVLSQNGLTSHFEIVHDTVRYLGELHKTFKVFQQ